MALINCPECKNKISDKAESCPKCGYELKKSSLINNVESVNKIKNIPKLYFIIGILIIGGLIWGYKQEKVKTKTQPVKGNEPTTEVAPSNNGYKSYYSSYFGISFTYPEDYSVVTGDDNLIYISRVVQNNVGAIPYVMIGRYDDYSSPIKFLEDFSTYIAKQYTDGFKVVSNIVAGNIGDKSVYGVTYNYNTNNALIVDNRYAILINNKVYMIASKEVNKNTEEINNVVSNVISSLKEGGV